jgi:lipopolysaccharide transport system ATP-binding protein
MKNAVIEVESLSKKYNLGAGGKYYNLRDYISEIPLRLANKYHHQDRGEPFWALKDVSFKLNRGEVLGVIGRNGAGKSTLLKILSRIVLPTHGKATIQGRVASMLEIGTGFNSELTGRENIYLNGAILGMKKKEIDRKFKSIVEFSEIGKFLDMAVKKYSSGMYVRLAFSVAAHLDPEIVLLDEVLAVGDLPFQRKSLMKMRSIAKDEGRTVVFVSHNLSSVDSLCNKAMLLEEGRLTAFGKTKEVISKYVSGFKVENNFLLKSSVDAKGLGLNIHNFWIDNSERQKTTEIKSGGHYFFNFQYSCPAPITSKGFDLGFIISTMIDQPLISSYLSYTNREIMCNQGEGVFVFEIPRLPLARGDYKITVQVLAGRHKSLCLSRTSQITVKHGDPLNVGKIVRQEYSPLFIGGDWTVGEK